MRSLRTPLWLSIPLLAIACSPVRVDDEGAGTLTPDVTVHELVPTVLTLSWTTEAPTVGYVVYGLEGGEEQSTPTEAGPTTEHSVTVFGLKAGQTYDLRAVNVDEQGALSESAPVTVAVEPPPEGLPTLTISDYDPDRVEPGGLVLTTVISTSGTWVTFIDRDGDYVWTWPVDQGVAAYGGRLDLEARSVYWLQVDDLGQSDVAGVMNVALDGSSQTFTRTVLGHHDAVRLPDDTVAWLSYEFREVDMDGERVRVASDDILELAEGGTESDMPDNRFALLNREEAYAHCPHFYLEVFDTGALDFSHANSLMYDADNDRYAVMNRNLDALMIIDRQTGDILTQIGGDHADVMTANPEDMWSHAHMSHMWDGGFMVFDNGDHREPEESRVSEYAYDEEAGTLELVWTWSDPDNLFNPFFGDAEKLTETWLTTWTTLGRMQEISAEGDVVWRMETELGYALGRGRWVEDLYTLSEAGR